MSKRIKIRTRYIKDEDWNLLGEDKQIPDT